MRLLRRMRRGYRRSLRFGRRRRRRSRRLFVSRGGRTL